MLESLAIQQRRRAAATSCLDMRFRTVRTIMSFVVHLVLFMVRRPDDLIDDEAAEAFVINTIFVPDKNLAMTASPITRPILAQVFRTGTIKSIQEQDRRAGRLD